MTIKLLVVQGPNLNLLGRREESIYGSTSLDDLHQGLEKKATQSNINITFFQSNHEGELVDKLQEARDIYDGIIINPAAYTHYSYAIADAIRAIELPVIEVHISNIYQREEFRQKSVIAPTAIGQISGLGMFGYHAALLFFENYFYQNRD